MLDVGRNATGGIECQGRSSVYRTGRTYGTCGIRTQHPSPRAEQGADIGVRVCPLAANSQGLEANSTKDRGLRLGPTWPYAAFISGLITTLV